MKVFSTVEDYLEVIAGKREIATAAVKQSSWFGGPPMAPIINLARYDVNFLDSVTDTTLGGQPLTDKQADLAIKLIEKYQRQLQAHGISIEGIHPPQYKKPLRLIDRTKAAFIQDGNIKVKFPFDNKLIDLIRTLGKESQGKIHFDKEARLWTLALTEYNLNWAMQFAQGNGFAIGAEMTELMTAILECEKAGYTIELCANDGQLDINNGANSLRQYITDNLGGFAQDNLVRLADYSAVLGYTINDELIGQLERTHGASNTLFMMHREYNLNEMSMEVIERVVNYARLTSRYPIVVYNPTPVETIDEWSRHFEQDQIYRVNNARNEATVVQVHHQLVYTHKPLKNLQSIPLLISHVGLILGTDKQRMVQNSQKIFYVGSKLSR